MPPPQQQPPLLPLRGPIIMLVCLYIGALILGVVSRMVYAYQIDLWAIDVMDSFIKPFFTTYTFDAFLHVVGLAPVPQPLPRYKRVLKFLRGMLPGRKTKPVEKTLIAWVLQHAKDIGVPIFRKGIELLSAPSTQIFMVVLLAVMFKSMCDMDTAIRKMQMYIHNLDRNAVLREERLTGLIMQASQRLDDLGVGADPAAHRVAFSSPQPDRRPKGLISRAGNFVIGFTTDRIAEASALATTLP